MIEHIKKVIKIMLLIMYKLMIKYLPIREDIILFESNLGRNYSGNPKYIYEKMVSLGLDKKYECCWVLEDITTKIPGKKKKIFRKRLRHLYYMAVAKIVVCDCRHPMFVIKRDEAVFIQTWHGTPLKKLALDMDDVNMEGEQDINEYKRKFLVNVQAWDYLLSQNSFSTDIFRRAFAFEKEILEIGYPRNDILINNNNEEYKNEVRRKLGIPIDKKVILYAPTWRDNEFHGKGKYKFVTALDYDMMKEALWDEYVMIVKYHYLVVDPIDWGKYKGFIYNCGLEHDIAPLYLAADMLITDYSSVMFDYSLLNRPMLFFAYDMENYKNNLRGFYFDFISEAPGPISLTTEELISDINNKTYEKYKEKYELFKEKFNHKDKGNSADIVIDLIERKIKEA